MKIISKYKDYYDYVAHQYGGGDEKIVYVRNGIDIDNGVVYIDEPSWKFGDSDMPYLPDWRYEEYETLGAEFKLLVVNGIIFNGFQI